MDWLSSCQKVIFLCKSIRLKKRNSGRSAQQLRAKRKSELQIISEELCLSQVLLLILSFYKACKNRVWAAFLIALLIPEVKELFPALVFFFNMLKNLSVAENTSDVPGFQTSTYNHDLFAVLGLISENGICWQHTRIVVLLWIKTNILNVFILASWRWTVQFSSPPVSDVNHWVRILNWG